MPVLIVGTLLIIAERSCSFIQITPTEKLSAIYLPTAWIDAPLRVGKKFFYKGRLANEGIRSIDPYYRCIKIVKRAFVPCRQSHSIYLQEQLSSTTCGSSFFDRFNHDYL